MPEWFEASLQHGSAPVSLRDLTARLAVAFGLRVGHGRDPAEVLKAVVDKHLSVARLRSTMTARQGAALDLTYLVRLRRDDAATGFVTELNQVEGVQSVELRHL